MLAPSFDRDWQVGPLFEFPNLVFGVLGEVIWVAWGVRVAASRVSRRARSQLSTRSGGDTDFPEKSVFKGYHFWGLLGVSYRVFVEMVSVKVSRWSVSSFCGGSWAKKCRVAAPECG